MSQSHEHTLTRLFIAYYQELAEARASIRRDKLAVYLDLPEQADTPDTEFLVGRLFQRLHAKLLGMRHDMRDLGSIAEQEDFEYVLYVMAALTDELLLLDTDWKGARAWQDNLMEQALFSSALAGTEYYTRVHTVISDSSRFQDRSDLAAVYLMGLSLGFRGRYRGQQGAEEIKKIREKIRKSMNLCAETEPLFIQAYKHVAVIDEDPDIHRLAPGSKWWQWISVFAAAYCLVATGIWFYFASSLSSSIDSLIDDGSSNDSRGASGALVPESGPNQNLGAVRMVIAGRSKPAHEFSSALLAKRLPRA